MSLCHSQRIPVPASSQEWKNGRSWKPSLLDHHIFSRKTNCATELSAEEGETAENKAETCPCFSLQRNWSTHFHVSSSEIHVLWAEFYMR